MQTLSDIIKQRYSCRSFDSSKLNNLIKRELQSYISSNNIGLLGEKIDLKIVEKDPSKSHLMKLTYGLIKNHNTYIIGQVEKGCQNRMSYGYVLEKAIIKATALGLKSCWIGYFDRTHFPEFLVDEKTEIPSLAIIGTSDKESIGNRIVRFSINANKRYDWNKLFFENDFITPLTKAKVIDYEESLEMLRLAPSSGNTQPWRVVLDGENKNFHFYKKVISQNYETKGLHDVDIGIALAHFELVSKFNRRTGFWQKIENRNINNKTDLQYMISWVV